MKEVNFNNVQILDTFWKNVNELLMQEKDILWFDHSAIKSIESWDNIDDLQKLKNDNFKITSLFHNIAGVYAIWINNNQKIIMTYIGQTTDYISHQRIYNHFISKDARTGSKLNNVKEAIKNGFVIGVSFVKINPKEMRQYVEQNLIRYHFGESEEKETWNIMGKGRKGKKINIIKRV